MEVGVLTEGYAGRNLRPGSLSVGEGRERGLGEPLESQFGVVIIHHTQDEEGRREGKAGEVSLVEHGFPDHLIVSVSKVINMKLHSKETLLLKVINLTPLIVLNLHIVKPTVYRSPRFF